MQPTGVPATGRERATLLVATLSHTAGAYANPRMFSGLDDDSLDELADDILDRGLDSLPIVQPLRMPDGGLVQAVISGQRRVRALERRGVISVECELEPERPYSQAVAAEMFADAVAANAQDEQLSTFEQVRAAALLAESKMEQINIARRLRRSKAWVSTMLKAWRSSTPELREAWRLEKIPDEQFKDLAEVDAALQGDALAEIVAIREKGDRSTARKQAKEKAEAASPTKPRKAKAEAEPTVPVTTWKDGKAKTEDVPVAAARAVVSSANRPPMRVVEEYAKLAKGPFPTGRDPYVRGALDMAAFVVGDIPDSKFEGAWRRFLEAMSRAMEKASKKAAKKRAPKASKPLSRMPNRVAKASAKKGGKRR